MTGGRDGIRRFLVYDRRLDYPGGRPPAGGVSAVRTVGLELKADTGSSVVGTSFRATGSLQTP